MNRAGDLLASRYSRQPSPKLISKNNTSIESGVGVSTNSIELPPEIESLITGSDYWKNAKRNRYKMLIRQGYLNTLLQLAKLAHKMATREHPSHWFAKFASKAQWERTLEFLAQLVDVRELAQRVAMKLKTAVTPFIYQQVWRGVNVERWADLALEVPHDKPGQSIGKYFTWLCRREALAS
jgi:hypothetical protein